MTEFPVTRATLLFAVQTPENREAWEEFVVIYRPVIYRMARRRGMQDADAQDVTQNVLVSVSEAIKHYDQQPGTRFRHWLRRVAKNAIVTAMTRRPKDAGAGGSLAADLLSEQSQSVTPELEEELTTEYMREQFIRAAATVRTDVTPETWDAFELTVVQNMSCEAAAEQIGKSVGTVYAARSRIMKRLRDQIERMEQEQS